VWHEGCYDCSGCCSSHGRGDRPRALGTLDGLNGWYKTDKDRASKVYIGNFDQDTCQALLKVGTPGVCLHLTFTEGEGGWWNIARSGFSTVIMSGPWRDEHECSQQSMSGKCLQVQVKEEAP